MIAEKILPKSHSGIRKGRGCMNHVQFVDDAEHPRRSGTDYKEVCRGGQSF